MEDQLITLLSTFGYPVIRQGSLAKDQAYPPTFFTFWNNDEGEQSFYDNENEAITHDFDVNAYSSSPNLAYDLIRQARALLKTNGWIITDRGYDVPSDEITHVGRGMTATYLQF